MTYFSDVVTQSRRDTSLVDSRGVLDAHWHDKPLVKAKRCRDGGEWNVFRVHSSLEKAIRHVYGCPDLSLGTVVQDVLDER